MRERETMKRNEVKCSIFARVMNQCNQYAHTLGICADEEIRQNAKNRMTGMQGI